MSIFWNEGKPIDENWEERGIDYVAVYVCGDRPIARLRRHFKREGPQIEAKMTVSGGPGNWWSESFDKAKIDVENIFAEWLSNAGLVLK